MVHSMYGEEFNTLSPRLLTYKKRAREHTYDLPQKDFSSSKMKKIDKSLFVALIVFFRKVLLHSPFSFFTNKIHNH